MDHRIISTILVLLVSGICQAVTPPTWPTAYNVSGTLSLPYAEITEPFVGWFEASRNRSRVDYYDSMVVTIQLGVMKALPGGTSYKLAPVYMSGKNQQKCFQVNGTVSEPMEPQSVLPDLQDFKHLGEDQLAGESYDIWQKVERVGQKNNKYTMWVNKAGAPLRYEMMGYDTLLGSHYDKYIMEYNKMTAFKSIPDDIFRPIKGMKCEDFPGPGDSEHRITMNPMAEYMSTNREHVDDMFDKFTKTHNKKYENYVEAHRRKHQFHQNVRYIHSKNRAGLSYSLAVNHMADMSDMERASMRGFRKSTVHDPLAIPYSSLADKMTDVPDHMDWRLYGAVTPVKDQATCGSCWSFGTSGAVEGAYFLKTGELVRLSQQELMDCSWDQGNNGCDGGEDFRSYQWILKHGLATQDAYGPYLGQDGICHSMNVSGRAQITGYVNVTAYDQNALRQAMAQYGPISVAIDASHKSLSFYANGVYYEPECGSGPDSLDHAVLAVGYGKLGEDSYWLVKNSWSTYWGNSGYVLMAQKDNNCGVASSPTFVLM